MGKTIRPGGVALSTIAVMATPSACGTDEAGGGRCPEDRYCYHSSTEDACKSVVIEPIEGEMDTTLGEFWYGDRQRLDDGLEATDLFCFEWYERHYGGPL